MNDIERALEALRAFKQRRGKTWIEDIQHCWYHDSYRRFGSGPDESGLLQGLRNDPHGGYTNPEFLKAFK